MNGAGGTAVKQIMKAIENGSLPTNETQRRLMALIENEANRMDGPADEELISACMDLLERLQGRTYTEDEARITALNQRIAAAIAKKEKQRRMASMAVRLMAAAAVILLFVGVRVSWFEQHAGWPAAYYHRSGNHGGDGAGCHCRECRQGLLWDHRLAGTAAGAWLQSADT